MFKRLLYVTVALLCMCNSVSAGVRFSGCSLGGGYVVNGPDYSDIIFYHDCDDKDDANKANGSATVTWGAGTSVDTTNQIVGSGCIDTNNSTTAATSIASSGNIDLTTFVGRVGFYAKSVSTSETGMIFDCGFSMSYPRELTSTNFAMRHRTTSTTNIAHDINISEWNFFEVKMDGTTGTLYVNGVSKGTSTGSASISENITLFRNDSGTVIDCLFDQLIISNDKDRDLYAIRNITDFS